MHGGTGCRFLYFYSLIRRKNDRLTPLLVKVKGLICGLNTYFFSFCPFACTMFWVSFLGQPSYSSFLSLCCALQQRNILVIKLTWRTLQKLAESQNDQNKWKDLPYSWTRRHSNIELTILKLTNKCKAILVKAPREFFLRDKSSTVTWDMS